MMTPMEMRLEELAKENAKLVKKNTDLENALIAREEETDQMIKAAETEAVRLRGLMKVFDKRCKAYHTYCPTPCGVEAIHHEARTHLIESTEELSKQMELEAERREQAQRAINVLLCFNDIHQQEKEGLHAAALLLGFPLPRPSGSDDDDI